MSMPLTDASLARQLVLDELFDLTLYRRLHEAARGEELRALLADLITVEKRHLAFWQDFFDIRENTLDLRRRLKLAFLAGACRLLGPGAVHLVLEAIEVHGIRKYLRVWEDYKDQSLGRAVKDILRDEFEHEDAIVSRMTVRKIGPARIRSLFLGFNDGLVEILGAVSGFFAAFQHASHVLMAGVTLAVAGSLSMAAGAYAAASSENEVRRVETGKARFLGGSDGKAPPEKPAVAAWLVGAGYFVGAAVPVLPVLFGARSVIPSLFAGAALVIAVSLILSFLSGMRAGRRIAFNLAIAAAAVAVTYAVGTAARGVWGVDL